MELIGKDTYKTDGIDILGPHKFFSMSVLYAPLLSSDATKLYFYLLGENSMNQKTQKHERLCNCLNMSIMEIQDAREMLEQMGLLKTYVKDYERYHGYIYHLRSPLTPGEFLNHEIFCRMYIKTVGVQAYETTLTLTQNRNTERNGYDEITKPFSSALLSGWTDSHEQQFAELRQHQSDHNEVFELPVQFDYDSFLEELSYLTVPASIRTKEYLKTIGEFGILYGIDPKRMQFLVGKSVKFDPSNRSKDTLDTNALRNRCMKEDSIYVNPNVPKTKYSIAPVRFLQGFQEGAPVSDSDAKLLEYLLRDLHMKPQVVNVLVEFILQNYEMKLQRNLVEKIATNWIRMKIDTVEKALDFIQSSQIKENKKKKPKAQTIKQSTVPQWEESQQTVQEDEQTRQLRETLQQELQRKGNS